MIGLDTNVLVRFFTADDEMQSPAARRVVESLDPAVPGYVSLLVLAELSWVLTRSYRFDARSVLEVCQQLAAAEGVVLQCSDQVRSALRDAAAGLDLADALIARAGAGAGCRTTVTFDRSAAAHPGFELLES